MKKVLAALNAAFVVVAALGWRGPAAHAAGGGRAPVGNGDLNGDGEIDISDAVYLLDRFFFGGPAPVAIECPAPAGKGLPATGQTKCYNAPSIEVSCDNSDPPGQDGYYLAGCPNDTRFVDNGDGTVTDGCTGLMWQRDTADVNGNGRVGNEDILTWEDGLKYCEELLFAGYDDWRLPNVRELGSLVDYGRLYPSIHPVFGVVLQDYPTSTRDLLNPAVLPGAWYVNFGDGQITHGGGVTAGAFVRAVRAGLWAGGPVGNGDVNGDGKIDLTDDVALIAYLFLGGPAPQAIVCPSPWIGLPATGQTTCYSAVDLVDCDVTDFHGQDGFYQAGCPNQGRFVKNGDRTVTDNCTGLMWQEDTADVNGNGTVGSEDLLTWADGLKYCEELLFAGYDDWRLPNVRELESLLDYGRPYPGIDPVFGAQWGGYWSSTPMSGGGAAYYVNDGVYWNDPAELKLVRAVRNAP